MKLVLCGILSGGRLKKCAFFSCLVFDAIVTTICDSRVLAHIWWVCKSNIGPSSCGAHEFVNLRKKVRMSKKIKIRAFQTKDLRY